MSFAHRVPRELRLLPFRGSVVIASGLLTWSRLRGPGWRRLLPDVYVAADVEMDHRMWCYAAIEYARAAGAAVSGLSAAMLLGVDQVPLGGAPVELTVPPGCRVASRLPFVRIVSGVLQPDEIMSFGGPHLTSPVRTAFDLAARLARPDAIAAVDELLHRRLVSPEALVAFGEVMAGRRGIARFATVFDLAEPLSESPMESILRVGLMDEGLPRPEAQVEVRDASGRVIARLDLAYRKQKVGIEYDGDHHRNRATFQADARRLNALGAEGWRIVRVTGGDIPRNIGRIAGHVRYLLRDEPPRSVDTG